MKKIIYLAFMLLCVSTLSAQDEKKPLVVASASMIHDMLDAIGGAFVQTDVIVPIGSDPHLYEATPSDTRLLHRADMVLVNGLTFEGWLDELIDNSGSQAEVVRITRGVEAIESQDYRGSADPHAWMDVENAIIYARNIRDALSRLVPEEAESIAFNYEVYKGQLETLHDYVKGRVQSIPPERRVLITSHDAFSYYGQAYGLELYALTGVSTESKPQTSDIRRVNRIIEERGIPAIFIESTINPKLIEQIASDKSVSIGGKLYADSLGDPGGEADTYIKMIRHNTNVIVDALADAVQVSEDKATDATNSLGSTGRLLVIGAIVLMVILGFIYLLSRKS